MGKINKAWHLAHIMPKKPTVDQRIDWHIAHSRHCGCREMPASIKEELKRRKIDI